MDKQYGVNSNSNQLDSIERTSRQCLLESGDRNVKQVSELADLPHKRGARKEASPTHIVCSTEYGRSDSRFSAPELSKLLGIDQTRLKLKTHRAKINEKQPPIRMMYDRSMLLGCSDFLRQAANNAKGDPQHVMRAHA